MLNVGGPRDNNVKGTPGPPSGVRTPFNASPTCAIRSANLHPKRERVSGRPEDELPVRPHRDASAAAPVAPPADARARSRQGTCRILPLHSSLNTHNYVRGTNTGEEITRNKTEHGEQNQVSTFFIIVVRPASHPALLSFPPLQVRSRSDGRRCIDCTQVTRPCSTALASS